jgi:hypothetical protein
MRPVANHDRIGIATGTARVLLDPGDPVWIEEPGYQLAQSVLLGAGCRIVPVPVDDEGINLSAGGNLLPKAEASGQTNRSILVHANGPHPLVQNSVHLERGHLCGRSPREEWFNLATLSCRCCSKASTGEDPSAPGSRRWR